ncbi:conserved hypothetical protein [Ixodes scapularis]|uniref:Uncharacterized protein n=1 Tax=Ixodes scapularis TaxID=6945 RepID=B7QDI4_IXOSC|nr:conserved hypothetical protein [Ixodes scapularis]|eukprot:XP_002413598.1 conserved hypothetical protein [Ixodes scapularis]
MSRGSGIIKKRILQTTANKAKENRLQKVKKLLQHFKADRVQKLLFMDKRIFTVEVTRNSQNHRQLLSPAARNSGKRRIRPMTLFPKSATVWGGIIATGKTPLDFINKGVEINAAYYQEKILRKTVLP